MPYSKSGDLECRLISSFQEIDPGEWNGCAATEQPFLDHAFFAALEKSGSIGKEAGWMIHPLAAFDQEGHLQGVVPLFAKSHSYGEYVFDWSWAEAYQKAGGSYYPKWQVSVPFTPVPGPRLLGSHKEEIAKALIFVCEQTQFSSLHLTFIDDADEAALLNAGFLIRRGIQYHWHNREYRDFADFLDHLNARKRKMIKKERASLMQAGIHIAHLQGEEILEKHWDFFYRCYLRTSENKWGHSYLNRSFFSLLGEAMKDRIVLMIAYQDGREIAAALNLRDNEAIYGRNWGALEEHPFLHFETCYYAAIEYAIKNRLKRVEAGAQGEHKIPRGYEPVWTKSAHHFLDQGFSGAVADFLKREGKVLEANKEALAELLPYGRKAV